MKKLLDNEERFIPKKIDKLWRVYDKANGSFPYQTIELGKISQDLELESLCATECERFNTEFVAVVAVKKQPRLKPTIESSTPVRETVKRPGVPPAKKNSGPPVKSIQLGVSADLEAELEEEAEVTFEPAPEPEIRDYGVVMSEEEANNYAKDYLR